MKGKSSLHVKLEALLGRFTDLHKINDDVLLAAEQYLFTKSGSLVGMKDNEMLETLLYLKEIMVLNSLKDIDAIELYYDNKKKIIKKFIDEVVIAPDAGNLNRFNNVVPAKIDWTKPSSVTCIQEVTEKIIPVAVKPVREKKVLSLCSMSQNVKARQSVNNDSLSNIEQYTLSQPEAKKRNPIIKQTKSTTMAKNGNTGDGHRNGAVDKRSQVLNPRTNQFVKRDAETGRFMDVKTSGGKFKGVRKEK